MHCGDDSKAFKAPTSTPTQDFEPLNKAQKDKKKKQHKDKKDSKNSATPATGINMAKVEDKKKRRKKDESEVTCFNCNKKIHYVNNCREPWKSKN